MDLLVYWLPIFGGLLLGGFAIGAWYGGNKIVAVWLGFAGALCFLVLAALQLQKAILSERRPPPIDARSLEGPIVSIDRVAVESLLNSQGSVVQLRFKGIMKNSGRTPALNMKTAVNLTGGASVLADDFDYPDIDSGQPATVLTLVPNQQMETGHFKIDAAYADRVRSGVSHLFFYGWIEYDDPFEGPARHRTEYCYRIEVAGDPRLKHNPLLFSQYGPYNCIDKGCRYAPGRVPPKKPQMPVPPGVAAE